MSEQLRLHQLRFTPLNITVKKIVRKLLSRLITPLQRREHYFKQTYSADIKHSSFHRFIHSPITLPVENQRIILAVCEHYSHHQYSLLGSGWVSLLHGAESKGFEGYRYDSRSISHSDSNGEWLAAHINSSNLRYAQTAWQHIPKPYQPLDWQRDCRSGFRWDSKQWHGELTISQGNGADPKLPWEFGRMHSLLHLALKYSILHDDYKQATSQEYRTHILDFITQNPPGFGIQWTSSMDVAIRAANIALSLDILHSVGFQPDAEFAYILMNALHDHCRFIYNHREWGDGMRGNHYLANLAGLLICSAYLPDSVERTRWIDFALAELNNDILYQFLDDGANFEASVPYHRLSTEMLCWAMGYADALGKTNQFKESAELMARLRSIITFSIASITPNGNVHSIGDDDSGRFLPLLPTVDDTTQANHSSAYHVHNQTHLLRCSKIMREYVDGKHNGTLLQSLIEGMLSATTDEPTAQKTTWENASFQDFGVDYYYNGIAHVALRAGSVGQYGKGGHAHADQLSITLIYEGRHILIDPGTYCYTSVHKKRNHYRSTSAHNTLQADSREQYEFPTGSAESLFWILGDTAHANVLYRTHTYWQARHSGFGIPHTRSVEFIDSVILITDECLHDGMNTVRFAIDPLCTATQHSDTIISVESKGTLFEFSFSHPCRIEQTTCATSYGVERANHTIIVQASGRDSCSTRISIKK